MREDQLDKIFEKFDKLDAKLGSIDVTLAKQEISLADHIRRTELAESAINHIEDDMKPLNKHVDMVQGALKLISLLATLVAICAGLLKLFSH